jgi:hypothetical protein
VAPFLHANCTILPLNIHLHRNQLHHLPHLLLLPHPDHHLLLNGLWSLNLSSCRQLDLGVLLRVLWLRTVIVKPHLRMFKSFIRRSSLLWELHSFEFLLVFFISQTGISLCGDVNRIVTRLITRGVVVLRLQRFGSLDLQQD